VPGPLHMRSTTIVALVVLLAAPVSAQKKAFQAGGEVTSRPARADLSRLTQRVSPGESALHGTVRVGADSAQRIAMTDFEWRGRVMSVEFDAADTRLFWDVKILPDNAPETVVRYRVDAVAGGIMDIREFTGIRGLRKRGPPGQGAR